MAFIIKQHDLRPYLTGQIKKPDGTPLDLTPVTQAFLVMRVAGSAAVHLKAGVAISDPVNGRFTYVWQSGDTDTAGQYDSEIELNWGAEPQTIPVDSYYRIIITDDIG